MLYKTTPIGKIEVSEWEEKELVDLTNDELLQRAISEHRKFCISPAVFAMVEKRLLLHQLQHMINPHVGIRHHIKFDDSNNDIHNNYQS